MKADSKKYKYQKHGERQYENILAVAERLFIEQGMENVSLTDIAQECGIMRATFYRYFQNKDDVLWQIYHRYAIEFGRQLTESIEASNGTTYDRFKIVTDILYAGFVANPQSYQFLDLFNDTYQAATADRDHSVYDQVFKEDEFRTGDTVRLLSENFYDGSVNPNLDSWQTAVSLIYSASYIVLGMSRMLKTMPLKYHISAQEVVRISLNALLEGIKA